MRCSSFERRLDAYVDGELSPPLRARVARHVAGCEHCASLLEELRVIDALLLVPRTLEPAPNFTFKAMAEIRAMPAPHAHRTSPLAILAVYVVFGWAAIAAFLALGGSGARATFALVTSWFAHAGAAAATAAGTTGRVFGHQTFDVTAAMGGILAADLVLAAFVVGAYSFVRARRTSISIRTETDPC